MKRPKIIISRIKIGKKSRRLIILGIVLLALLGLVFFLLRDRGIIFREKGWQPPSGPPPAPKGRVGPSAEWLEKHLKPVPTSPSGEPFRGPTAPPPGF